MSLLGRTTALALVAALTRSDDIVPALASSLNNRNDVIERQVVARKAVAAVLTDVIIAEKHIDPRESDDVLLLLDRNVVQQPENGGNFYRHPDGADFVSALFNDLYLALEEELNGSLPAHEV